MHHLPSPIPLISRDAAVMQVICTRIARSRQRAADLPTLPPPEDWPTPPPVRDTVPLAAWLLLAAIHLAAWALAWALISRAQA